MKGVQLGDLEWPYRRILSVILTYKGSALVTIERKLSELSDIGRPDVYLDLQRGILIKNEGILFSADSSSPYLHFDDPAIGLARLLALLSKVTGRLVMHGVEWDAYIT